MFHSVQDLTRSQVEPVSPVLASGFFTTEPTGKSSAPVFIIFQAHNCAKYDQSGDPEILHLKLFLRMIFHISVGVGEVHSLYRVESGRTSRVLKDSQLLPCFYFIL